MAKDFLKVIQRLVAVSAIPASALRNQGPSGMVACARDFLTTLPLQSLATPNEGEYATVLDETTEALRSQFPRGGRKFGPARKAINLFARDALYNQYLCAAYHLDVAIDFMEIPLDSITAAAIFKADPSIARWPGVSGLTIATSASYQRAAARVAAKCKVARVHLDAYWWGAVRDA